MKLLVTLSLLLASTSPASAQGEKGKEETRWIEDRILVRVEEAQLTKDTVILNYTVTNKSGVDIELFWNESGAATRRLKELEQEVRRRNASKSKSDYVPKTVGFDAFIKLKKPPSFTPVSSEGGFLRFLVTSLPADMPIRFSIAVRLSSEDKPSTLESVFSSDKEVLRAVVARTLGNAEAIVLLLPDRSLKISFPIPR